jgi:hypothetical protein
MKQASSRFRPWLAATAITALVACGGGGGRNEILGFTGAGGTASGGAVATAVNTALASARTYGAFAGAGGMTNTGTFTVITGDAGTTATGAVDFTGFHSPGVGCSYTETGANIGSVTGAVNTAGPPPSILCPTEGTVATAALATTALADAQRAYNVLAAYPPGVNPGQDLGGLTLAPGIYTSAPGTFQITGSDLTLDAQGDPNATWVFQMASSLTVGTPGFPRSVLLTNGAQAKNVFWQVGSVATLNPGGGGTFSGTVLATAGVKVSTAASGILTTINGRLISVGAGSNTLVNTIVNVPAP